MALEPRTEGREELVLVRLSDVDRHLRDRVAAAITRLGELEGIDALLFAMATTARRHDPTIRVPAWKADLVLRDRRLPPGPMPKVWTWP